MKYKALTAAISLAISPNLWAQTQTHVLANELEISGLNGEQNYQLRLQLPDKQIRTLTLQPAKAISFSSDDFAISGFADGLYKYELFPIAKTKQTRRLANEEQATDSGMTKLSGSFTVLNGQTVDDQDEGESSAIGPRAPLITGDQSINDSLCVGVDCLNSESYGFDTIRLKENNLRIKFDDTSTAAFPANDWELTANDSASGGLSFFGITDATAGNRPLTIEAGAGADALYVDSVGNVGLGTSTPVIELHVVDGDTAAVRLDQNGTGGLATQVWDIAGNETNFFIRDVTNANMLPFSIRPNSPDRSLDIHPNGIEFLNNKVVIDDDFRLGLNTNNPRNNIHIKEPTGNAGIILENLSDGVGWKFTNKSTFFEISKSGTGTPEFAVYDTGRMKVGAGGATPNFDMDASGNVTIQGVLSQNSDVNIKENIHLVNTAEVLNKVMDLPISIWNYKFDDESVKHLGPMAQDFFKQFNLGAADDKITTIDTSGVALASIKELGKKASEKDQEIQSLKAQNEQLNQRLSALEEAIKSLK